MIGDLHDQHPIPLLSRVDNIIHTDCFLHRNLTFICLFCNFNTKAWKDYLRLHEDFNDWIKRLRKKTSYLAKRNIAQIIEEGDFDASKWWIEHEEKGNRTAKLGANDTLEDSLSIDDEAILEAYVTKTITLKQTAKIPLSKTLKPVTENN